MKSVHNIFIAASLALSAAFTRIIDSYIGASGDVSILGVFVATMISFIGSFYVVRFFLNRLFDSLPWIRKLILGENYIEGDYEEEIFSQNGDSLVTSHLSIKIRASGIRVQGGSNGIKSADGGVAYDYDFHNKQGFICLRNGRLLYHYEGKSVSRGTVHEGFAELSFDRGIHSSKGYIGQYYDRIGNKRGSIEGRLIHKKPFIRKTLSSACADKLAHINKMGCLRFINYIAPVVPQLSAMECES